LPAVEYAANQRLSRHRSPCIERNFKYDCTGLEAGNQYGNILPFNNTFAQIFV
jgi:hypothetical protein